MCSGCSSVARAGRWFWHRSVRVIEAEPDDVSTPDPLDAARVSSALGLGGGRGLGGAQRRVLLIGVPAA
jgi:hypothetical protein